MQKNCKKSQSKKCQKAIKKKLSTIKKTTKLLKKMSFRKFERKIKFYRFS